MGSTIKRMEEIDEMLKNTESNKASDEEYDEEFELDDEAEES